MTTKLSWKWHETELTQTIPSKIIVEIIDEFVTLMFKYSCLSNAINYIFSKWIVERWIDNSKFIYILLS